MATSSIKLFETHHVRSEWDAERELWYFSIVDVVRDGKRGLESAENNSVNDYTCISPERARLKLRI